MNAAPPSRPSRASAAAHSASHGSRPPRNLFAPVLWLLIAAGIIVASTIAAGASAMMSAATEPASSSLRVTGIAYELSYDANGGDPATVPRNEVSPPTLERTHTFSVADEKPARDGFRFVGWANDPDGDIAYRPGDPVELASEAPHKTLYALWADNAVLAPGKIVNQRMKNNAAIGANPAYTLNDRTVLSVTIGTPAQHAAAVAGTEGQPIAVEDDFDLARVDDLDYTDAYPYSDAIMLYRVPNGGGFDVYLLSEWKVFANQLSDYLFNNLNAATSIGPLSFDTSRVRTMSYMLAGCFVLDTFDVSGFDTSNVEDMSFMFASNQSLASLDVGGFDTKRVTTFKGMFRNCFNLPAIDVSAFDTGAAADLSELFRNCRSLTALDLSSFDTSANTTLFAMFSGCWQMTDLDLSMFDTSRVTTTEELFSSCMRLRSIDLSSFDTSNVVTAFRMFSNCQSLASLDVTGFDTGRMTNMGNMFYNCMNLTELDVSSFDTSQVATMEAMFSNLKKVSVLDLSTFDTSLVEQMGSMFASSPALASVNVSSFDTGRVKSMTSMFAGCSSLEELDLSSFDTGRVTQMGNMLRQCKNLVTVHAGSGWTTASVASSSGMFVDDAKLVGGAGTAYDASHTDAAYARIDGGPDAPGYLTGTGETAADRPAAAESDNGVDDNGIEAAAPNDRTPDGDDAPADEQGGADESADGPEHDQPAGPATSTSVETAGRSESSEGAEASAAASAVPARAHAAVPRTEARALAPTAGSPMRAIAQKRDAAVLVQASAPARGVDSSVVFEGGAQRFVFEPGTDYAPTDLFPSLKSVMPGDRIVQRISVRADESGQPVELFLRSHGASQGTEAFLARLTLEVQRETGETISRGPAHLAGDASSWVSLGTFEPGDAVDLVLTLEAPSDLGDEYRQSQGIIDWEFRADDASDRHVSSWTGAGARTGGDGSHGTAGTGDGRLLAAALLAAAIASLALLVAHKRRS